jgi:uncharacterized membrane protein YhaH (DUF805 family)
MYPVMLFLVGVATTAVLALGVVSYLKPSLHDVLVDLCGTTTRAAFWTAFSTVTIAITPIMFALHYRPDMSEDAYAVFEIGRQLELALAGLLLSVVLLAVVLAKFIPREPVRG